ncbi:uncharacterized protein LOC127279067 [Leptopilina boulardi]|uniref:uncharacterized protein LOC127279067 n=1 Tax=Leptopilina boulardi TaxID=63433 RepID=UPI0021F59F55|nr:uncharacterized protein LOC127279067 [Leptopilina boulardi]
MRILQINKEIEVQNKNSKPVVVVEKLFCEICQVSCASSFNEHLSEEKHLSKMKHEFKNIVMNNLVENTSFTNYLALFLKTVGPSEEVFASYKQICFRFNRLFRNLFPMCTMQQIGSTLTSLCFNTNNLKIYVDKGKGIDLKLIKFFNKAKSVIFGNSNLFSDVKIHSKKLKIITFLDNKTNITCELHFSNAMSVYSSLLIKHYLSFDTRIKPLMMIIKYWAKQCGISGRFTSQKITSYALVMLVIFYLQQPNVNLVPPIITLKEICNPKIVDGWQVNFDKKIQHSSAKNESSIPELLYGFFNFYANFDFNEFVICPIDGCAHSKKSFKYIDNLPKCMDRYKKYITDTEDVLPLDIENLLCIQDPIELNNNCSDNVSKSFVKYFQRQASQAARIYKSSEIVKKKDDNKKSEINLKLLKDSRFCNSSEIVKKKDDNKKSRKINLKLLKPILKQDTTFDNILDAFINKVTLNDEAIEDLYQPICAKLNKLLRLSFPKSQTYRYGSTVSGLCFKNSDLDLCLNIGEPMNENDVSSEIWTFQEVFTEAYFLLKEKGSYKKILPIPKARVPIIKFIHKKEKISCDLSFNNSLSIYNSRLIKHYLTFDTRIKPLILIIKYWANLCELKITSYALVMLVIFFLQQPNINLVPSIITLNGKCNPEIVDGWQVNFDEKIQYSSAKNKSSIPELLYGFFNFYANFDFDNFVICPIDGCAHFKETFEDISKLPKSMNRYKEYMRNTKNAIPLTMKKIFCLQDPIALNANCTINFNNNFLKAFRNYFSTAEKVCVTALENNSSQLLINLFETITKKKNKRHCKIRNEN